MTERKATIARTTSETDIKIALNLDGSGNGSARTGIPFLDHMLTLFAKHGIFDLDVSCKGDLEIDAHHSVEDVGICLGLALEKALGDKKRHRPFCAFLLSHGRNPGPRCRRPLRDGLIWFTKWR